MGAISGPHGLAPSGGAARLRRDAPIAGGFGGHFGAPMGWRRLEERHGFAGTLRRLGGLGGHFGAPMGWRGLEERHGFAGTLRRLGGLGGHFGAPHFLRSGRGERATSQARRRSRSAATPPRTAAGGRGRRTPAPPSGR